MPDPKTAEQQAVLRSVRKLVDFWQIEPEELSDGTRKEAPQPPRPTRVATGPKYQHPVSGVTWDGEGPQPQWLKDALTREGYTVDALRCHPEVASSLDNGPLQAPTLGLRSAD